VTARDNDKNFRGDSPSELSFPITLAVVEENGCPLFSHKEVLND